MSPKLHELEAARRALADLIAGEAARCCLLEYDFGDVPCELHGITYPGEILDLNPTYRTLEELLEEAIETKRQEHHAQHAR